MGPRGQALPTRQTLSWYTIHRTDRCKPFFDTLWGHRVLQCAIVHIVIVHIVDDIAKPAPLFDAGSLFFVVHCLYACTHGFTINRGVERIQGVGVCHG